MPMHFRRSMDFNAGNQVITLSSILYDPDVQAALVGATGAGSGAVITVGAITDASATGKAVMQAANAAAARAAIGAGTSFFDGDYNSLLNRPALFDGAYSSLTGKPTIPTTAAEVGAATPSYVDEALAGVLIDYSNAAPGSRFTMLYNGTTGFVNPANGAVASARPSARTDIYFDLIGGSSAVTDPAWLLNGDAREITS